MSQEDFMIH